MKLTYDLNPDDNPTGQELGERMRQNRNRLLKSSDWTQLPDCPLSDAQKYAWAEYRQQLRDFPATWTPSDTANFPEPPQ